MKSKNQQHTAHPKRDEVLAPIRTLAHSESPVLIGTLVWAKHSGWPWWPGLVVSNNDIGWPAYLKKKDSHCILWLGPTKNASVMAVDKISDFLDPNLIRLMNQSINKEGQEQEKATLEALRGLMSQRISDENEINHIPVRKLKSLAVQTRIEAEFINGRKQAVVDTSSCWFQRTIESLKSSDEIVLNQKKETRLPIAINSQKRMIIEAFPPAIDYCERSAKNTVEEEGDKPPPKSKIALAKQTGQGTSLMQTFLHDEQLRGSELQKLLDEEEKTRDFEDDVDLAINQHEAVLLSVPAFPVPVL